MLELKSKRRNEMVEKVEVVAPPEGVSRSSKGAVLNPPEDDTLKVGSKTPVKQLAGETHVPRRRGNFEVHRRQGFGQNNTRMGWRPIRASGRASGDFAAGHQ